MFMNGIHRGLTPRSFCQLADAFVSATSIPHPEAFSATKDPYGYSSLGLMQAANQSEFLKDGQKITGKPKPGVLLKKH